VGLILSAVHTPVSHPTIPQIKIQNKNVSFSLKHFISHKFLGFHGWNYSNLILLGVIYCILIKLISTFRRNLHRPSVCCENWAHIDAGNIGFYLDPVPSTQCKRYTSAFETSVSTYNNARCRTPKTILFFHIIRRSHD
jgi:hypothetical protein